MLPKVIAVLAFLAAGFSFVATIVTLFLEYVVLPEADWVGPPYNLYLVVQFFKELSLPLAVAGICVAVLALPRLPPKS